MREVLEMTKEEAIEWLIDDDIDTCTEANEWFRSVMKNGFIGYNQYTDENLENEINDRRMDKDELPVRISEEGR